MSNSCVLPSSYNLNYCLKHNIIKKNPFELQSTKLHKLQMLGLHIASVHIDFNQILFINECASIERILLKSR